jgi:galactose mutarotase-like enzyme
MVMDPIDFASDELRCSVNPLGAELWRIADVQGRDWLWDGDPSWWTGRAPILFPIVGMLKGGCYRFDGRTYALEKHGFARRRPFDVVDMSNSAVTLQLVADDETRAVYPFEFRLLLRFEATGRTVTVDATVSNDGRGPMPFSFGFHPALRWPLPGGVRADATLRFDRPEPGPILRMNKDGLIDRSEPSPADTGLLKLRDALFADDAMIIRGVNSRGATFDCGGASARIDWRGLPDLGLWTKPGAPYLCIEPWQGFNDPEGFDGDLTRKPGIVTLAPGADWTARIAISV